VLGHAKCYVIMSWPGQADATEASVMGVALMGVPWSV
jgi:hypothetical protein